MPSAGQEALYWEQPRRSPPAPPTAAASQYPYANCPATSPTASHQPASAAASQYPHGNGPSHGRPAAFGAEFGASFSKGDNQPQQPSRYAPMPARFDMTANDGRAYFDHKVAQQPAYMYNEKTKHCGPIQRLAYSNNKVIYYHGNNPCRSEDLVVPVKRRILS